jgi:hypothetical protein
MEYLVSFTGKQSAQLLVIPPYNYASYRFTSYGSLVDSGVFERMQKLINKESAQEDGKRIAPIYENTSELGFGPLEKSNNLWTLEGNVLSLRIPWTRINVSDPSRGRVLDDGGKFNTDPLKDQLMTTLSEGIGISFVLVDSVSDSLMASFPEQGVKTPVVFPWKSWDEPEFTQRLKDSYPIIRKYVERFSAK